MKIEEIEQLIDKHFKDEYITMRGGIHHYKVTGEIKGMFLNQLTELVLEACEMTEKSLIKPDIIEENKEAFQENDVIELRDTLDKISKDSWNGEEVEQRCRKAFIAGMSYKLSDINEYRYNWRNKQPNVDKWIEENL